MTNTTYGELVLGPYSVVAKARLDGTVFVPLDGTEVSIINCDLTRCDLSRLKWEQIRHSILRGCRLPKEGTPSGDNLIEPIGDGVTDDTDSIIFRTVPA